MERSAEGALWVQRVALLSGVESETTLGGVRSCGSSQAGGWLPFSCETFSSPPFFAGQLWSLAGFSWTALPFHVIPSLCLFQAVCVCRELRPFLLRVGGVVTGRNQ